MTYGLGLPDKRLAAAVSSVSSSLVSSTASGCSRFTYQKHLTVASSGIALLVTVLRSSLQIRWAGFRDPWLGLHSFQGSVQARLFPGCISSSAAFQHAGFLLPGSLLCDPYLSAELRWSSGHLKVAWTAP